MTAPHPALAALVAALELEPAVVAPLSQLAGAVLSVLGPLRTTAHRAADLPDGYRGVARRGPMDRLLTSEWGLADAAPDEFVRRWAAGELSYFDLERVTPRADLVVDVVFDAGPAQLGQPRLLHLATLLALGARASAASATLRWRTAQAPEVVREGVGRSSVRALLAARSLAPFRAPAVTDPPADEVWWVGGPELPVPRGTAHVCVAESLVDGAPGVSLDVRAPGRPARTVALSLPAPPVQRRLLKDPFLRARPPARPSAPTSAPGSRVVLPDELARVVVARWVAGTEKVELLDASGALAHLSTSGGRLQPGVHPVPVGWRSVATGWSRGGPRRLGVSESGTLLLADAGPIVSGALPPLGNGRLVYADGAVFLVAVDGVVSSIRQERLTPTGGSLHDVWVHAGRARWLLWVGQRLLVDGGPLVPPGLVDARFVGRGARPTRVIARREDGPWRLLDGRAADAWGHLGPFLDVPGRLVGTALGEGGAVLPISVDGDVIVRGEGRIRLPGVPAMMDVDRAGDRAVWLGADGCVQVWDLVRGVPILVAEPR